MRRGHDPRAAADRRTGPGSARRGAGQLARHRDVPGVHRDHSRHHLLGRQAHQDRHRLLRRRTRHHGVAERPRDRRRLYVGRLVPRHCRAGLFQRLLRPELLGRLAGRLADRAVPDCGAAAQLRQIHLRRRRLLPPEARADPCDGRAQHLGGGDLLPDRPDGRCRPVASHPAAAVRLLAVDHHRRRTDHHLCDLRRHEGDNLGADHQGGAAPGRRDPAGAAGAGAFQLQPRRHVRRGGPHPSEPRRHHEVDGADRQHAQPDRVRSRSA